MTERRCRHRSASFALLVLAACATGSGRGDAPARVAHLTDLVENLHIEAERARATVSDSFERLNALAAGRFDVDPAPVLYARFVQALDVATEDNKRFAERLTPLLEAAEPIFAERRKDIEQITSERLRQRAEMRFALAKERYEAITRSAVPAQQQFAAFVEALRNHALFLGHDLNTSAIDDIQQDVKELAKNVLELDRNLEATMAAARAYVENQAPPAAVPSR